MIDLNPLLLNLLKQHKPFSGRDYEKKVDNLFVLHEQLSALGIAALDIPRLYQEYPKNQKVLEKVISSSLSPFYDKIISRDSYSTSALASSLLLGDNSNKLKILLNRLSSVMGKSFVIHWLENYQALGGRPSPRQQHRYMRPTLMSLIENPPNDLPFIDTLFDVLLECDLIPERLLNTLLFKALKDKNHEKAKKLIQNGADPQALDSDGRGISAYATDEFLSWVAHEQMTPKVIVEVSPQEAIPSFDNLNLCEQLVAKILLQSKPISTQAIFNVVSTFKVAGMSEDNPLRLKALTKHEAIRRVFKGVLINPKNVPMLMSVFTVDNKKRNEDDGLLGLLEEQEISAIREILVKLLNANDKADEFFNFYNNVIRKFFSEKVIVTLLTLSEGNQPSIFERVMETRNSYVFVSLIRSFPNKEVRKELASYAFNYLITLLKKAFSTQYRSVNKNMLDTIYSMLALCGRLPSEKIDMSKVSNHLMDLLTFDLDDYFRKFYEQHIESSPELLHTSKLALVGPLVEEIAKKGKKKLFKQVINSVTDENQKAIAENALWVLGKQFLGDPNGRVKISEGHRKILHRCFNHHVDLASLVFGDKNAPVRTFLDLAFVEDLEGLFGKLLAHKNMSRTMAEESLHRILRFGKGNSSGVFSSLFSTGVDLNRVGRYIGEILDKFPDLAYMVKDYARATKDNALLQGVEKILGKSSPTQTKAKPLASTDNNRATAESSASSSSDHVVVEMEKEAPVKEQEKDIEMQPIPAADTSGADAFLQNALARGARESEASSSSPAGLLSTSRGSPLNSASSTVAESSDVLARAEALLAIMSGAPSAPTEAPASQPATSSRRVMSYQSTSI